MRLIPRIRRLAGLGILIVASCARHDAGQAVIREPDTASRLHVADTAAAAGQTDIALSMYNAAAAAAPDNVEAQTRLVSLLIKSGQPEVAGQVLSRALVRQPSDPTLLRWLGNLRLETGAAEAALKIFDGLVARKSTNIAALNGRGVALDLLGQHEVAQQTYRTAQTIAPGDVQTANNLAVSFLLSNRPTDARDILVPLSQQPDLPARVLNNLALAQTAAGDTSAADASLAGRAGADDLRIMAATLAGPGGYGLTTDLPASPAARLSAKPAG